MVTPISCSTFGIDVLLGLANISLVPLLPTAKPDTWVVTRWDYVQ